ncbi:MAG TPA: glycosyltransferase family A protein [Chthonomonadales bacterium]|nr:glycosyltransferase family A protein [Chthonomonadales bacterium]
MRVDLVLVGQPPAVPAWQLGDLWAVPDSAAGLARAIGERLPASIADAWLFWDPALGAPDPEAVEAALARPGDVFHAGLRLGTGGLPRLRDMVGAGMWDADPPAEIEATSWRVSFRACLARTPVLRHFGGPGAGYRTLDAAALEWGRRCLDMGAFVRHMPELLPAAAALAPSPPSLPFVDEVRFVRDCSGTAWARWALLRAAMVGDCSLPEAYRAWREVSASATPGSPGPFTEWYAARDAGASMDGPRVTVLIPTVDRYPYLRTLLDQLRRQTVRPTEIVVIDQTAPGRRDGTLPGEFGDLPLVWMVQDEPGQCTSRNAGLLASCGDYVLFVDDDDEVGPTLIEDHLRTLGRFRVDVSSGVAEEVGGGPLPANFRYVRASDVFPTNNTLIRRRVLGRSGLFDVAYNRGQRADGDLGTRIHLSGALMVLNPAISVLHHHAPSGGLRKHRARVITYASSRTRITHRQLMSATEFYLARRYGTERKVREGVWRCVLGTFSVRGGRARKLLKALVSLACLPHTLLELRRRDRLSREMLKRFPEIPEDRI